MRVMVFVAVAGAFLVCGGVVFAVVRLLGKGPVELVFVVGAIVGAQVGAALHHRAAGARDSMGVKVRVGRRWRCVRWCWGWCCRRGSGRLRMRR